MIKPLHIYKNFKLCSSLWQGCYNFSKIDINIYESLYWESHLRRNFTGEFILSLSLCHKGVRLDLNVTISEYLNERNPYMLNKEAILYVIRNNK